MTDPTVVLIKTGSHRCAGPLLHHPDGLTITMSMDERGTTAMLEIRPAAGTLRGIGVVRWYRDIYEVACWRGDANIGETTYDVVSSPGGTLTFTRPARALNAAEMAAIDAGDETAGGRFAALNEDGHVVTPGRGI